MKKLFAKYHLVIIGLIVTLPFLMQSCGSKSLIIPHSISTASAVKVSDLNLKEGQYEILQTIVETASITCEYKEQEIKIVGDDFNYHFIYDAKKKGWYVKSFSGAASLGYFSSDIQDENARDNFPRPEEFARRVAMARIINAASDYGADGIIEPVTTSVASNAGNRKVEYTSTVRAKLIAIKKTH